MLSRHRFQLLTLATLLVLLLATNRWPGWEEGIHILSLADVENGSARIAAAAPSFPAEPVHFHQAQRFVVPYLIGVASVLLHVPAPWLFGGVTFAAFFCVVFGIFVLLASRAVPGNRALLASALFALSPYTLRYYWIGTGLAADAFFQLATLGVIAGLLSGRRFLLFACLVVAVLARQTAVMLLPGLIYVLWRGDRKLTMLASLCIVAGLYLTTAAVARSFSLPGENMGHLLGFFLQVFNTGTATPAMVAEHAMRCVLPLLPCALLLSLSGRRALLPESLGLLLMALAIASQPFLGGPAYTGQNAARLVIQGLLPLVLAWAFAEKGDWSRKATLSLLGILFLGSFHHLYSSFGPATALGTAVLQLAVALATLAIGWYEIRRRVGNG